MLYPISIILKNIQQKIISDPNKYYQDNNLLIVLADLRKDLSNKSNMVIKAFKDHFYTESLGKHL